jgi:DNA (cytosine-5)-methyltransferase 1
MKAILDELGYRVKHHLVRAQFLDVPQKRERLLILAVRKDLDFPMLVPKEQDYTVSLREALRNCPPSQGSQYPMRKAEIMAQVPEGGYWRDLPKPLQKEYMKGSLHLSGGKTGMARRLSWSEPSLTLTCSPCQKQTERCHPSETRPLNVREYARLQTFPDDWNFAGSVASQYRQVGNAVPVNLGYHVARCLICMLNPKEKRASCVEMPSVGQESVAQQMSLLD